MNDFFLVFIFIVTGIISLFRIVFNNSPAQKGARGESRIARILKNLDPAKYVILNDVMLKTSRGSSQIDHIVVSIYGIFVIETKNYTGWIHGNENSEYWSQTIYKKKHKLRNPVKQNWAHIFALKEVLSAFKGIRYYPIVVFTGDGELKNITSKVPVIYKNKIIKTIKNLSTSTCLSMEQAGAIIDRLKREDSIAPTMREHKKQVRHTIHDRIEKERTLVCPRCGGDLTVRNGNYGKFYGCSGYPKCRYTKKYGGQNGNNF